MLVLLRRLLVDLLLDLLRRQVNLLRRQVNLLWRLVVDLLRRLVVDLLRMVLPNMVLHSWRLLVVLRFRLHETASSLL
jgi:hypothetical protein